MLTEEDIEYQIQITAEVIEEIVEDVEIAKEGFDAFTQRDNLVETETSITVQGMDEKDIPYEFTVQKDASELYIDRTTENFTLRPISDYNVELSK